MHQSSRNFVENLINQALANARSEQVAFVCYLAGRVHERMDEGRSVDCDEYQALAKFAKL